MKKKEQIRYFDKRGFDLERESKNSSGNIEYME